MHLGRQAARGKPHGLFQQLGHGGHPGGAATAAGPAAASAERFFTAKRSLARRLALASRAIATWPMSPGSAPAIRRHSWIASLGKPAKCLTRLSRSSATAAISRPLSASTNAAAESAWKVFRPKINHVSALQTIVKGAAPSPWTLSHFQMGSHARGAVNASSVAGGIQPCNRRRPQVPQSGVGHRGVHNDNSTGLLERCHKIVYPENPGLVIPHQSGEWATIVGPRG